jgi:hypothetical protein
MLCFEDCLSLCGLTQDEVHAIAEHEHITEIAATQLGNYLVGTPDGEQFIKAMIRDDILHARAMGNRERELVLRTVLRNFVAQHPRCEDRHRKDLHLPERRSLA